jgi:hypothetical protein
MYIYVFLVSKGVACCKCLKDITLFKTHLPLLMNDLQPPCYTSICHEFVRCSYKSTFFVLFCKYYLSREVTAPRSVVYHQRLLPLISTDKVAVADVRYVLLSKTVCKRRKKFIIGNRSIYLCISYETYNRSKHNFKKIFLKTWLFIDILMHFNRRLT